MQRSLSSPDLHARFRKAKAKERAALTPTLARPSVAAVLLVLGRVLWEDEQETSIRLGPCSQASGPSRSSLAVGRSGEDLGYPSSREHNKMVKKFRVNRQHSFHQLHTQHFVCMTSPQ